MLVTSQKKLVTFQIMGIYEVLEFLDKFVSPNKFEKLPMIIDW